jgi:uncharacterized protein (DUF58 family)
MIKPRDIKSTKKIKKPNFVQRFNQWLEKKWVSPSYAGWVVGGIAICFFGAATNTMAGWLYVLSGLMFSLLIISAILARKALQNLKIRRYAIAPVSAGEELTLELEIENLSKKPQNLLQIMDLLPDILNPKPIRNAIELISPYQKYRWLYSLTAPKRGVYQWEEIKLRTGNPFGLFWCSKSYQIKAKAIIYPQVLPLKSCPLLDQIGQDENKLLESRRLYQNANEGLTRALRPYRQGDPTRLIHWKSSAKFGELQVRELEIVTGGEEIIICLDTASNWQPEDFETAVTAAASLYFYGSRQQMNIKLWTAKTGLVYGNWVVLETLAKTQPAEGNALSSNPLPKLPLIWLTQNPSSLHTLPFGSGWLLFPPDFSNPPLINLKSLGLIVDPQNPLQIQLQSQLQRFQTSQ